MNSWSVLYRYLTLEGGKRMKFFDLAMRHRYSLGFSTLFDSSTITSDFLVISTLNREIHLLKPQQINEL